MNKNVTDYKVIRGNDDNELTLRVKHAITEGWQPIGGVSFHVQAGEGKRNCQAMVKYQKYEMKPLIAERVKAHDTA